MMLKQDITLKIGIPIQNAIIKVDNFSGHAENMTFWANVYLNEQTAQNGSYLERHEYNFTLDTSDEAKEIYRQAYAHLKALPEYADAIDVQHLP